MTLNRRMVFATIYLYSEGYRKERRRLTR